MNVLDVAARAHPVCPGVEKNNIVNINPPLPAPHPPPQKKKHLSCKPKQSYIKGTSTNISA